MGYEIAGVVESVGVGVTRFAVGDQVYANGVCARNLTMPFAGAKPNESRSAN